MYLENYQLKEKPFQITTDSRFLWLGEKHKEAFATLKYGILENKGFLLLTGDVGTGKTTLINALIKNLRSEVFVAVISDPRLSEMDFFRYLAKEFSIEKPFQSKGEFLTVFAEFLQQAYAKGKQVLLIADEAQRLSPSLLEEIRHLSNIEKEHVKLLNIFFVGQIEFNNILRQKKNKAICQRITVNYTLERLTEQETGEYIRHRMKVAGCNNDVFSKEAVCEVFKFSHGAPRLINIICDMTLLTGYVEGEKKIDAEMVAECAVELKISLYDDNDSQGLNISGNQAVNKESEAVDSLAVSSEIETIEINLAGVRKKRGDSFSVALIFVALVVLIGGLCVYFFYI